MINIFILGWGRTIPNGDSAQYLQEAKLNIVKHNVCYKRNKAIHPVDKKTMVFIESMVVKSLITSPDSGVKLPKGERSVRVHGHAWAGDHRVKALDLSIDFGATWIKAKLDSPANPYAWQNFSQTVQLPQEGYYEIWARATDIHGRMQPFAIAWNPKGYMNNSMHRISVYAS